MSLRIAIRIFATMAFAMLVGPAVALDATGAAKPTVVPLLARDVPEFAGKEITVATVEYLPGGASAPHRHHAHVVVYVLEGRYATQVAGGERLVLGPGETFYENPADEHVVSQNASATEPVKILVFMLKDKPAGQ
jgi:quercetin dioxygenase-like cupin family protein